MRGRGKIQLPSRQADAGLVTVAAGVRLLPFAPLNRWPARAATPSRHLGELGTQTEAAVRRLPGALVSLLFLHAGGAHAPHKIAIREAP